jgi:hypothetical protein
MDLIKQYQDKFRCNQKFIIMQVCITCASDSVAVSKRYKQIACHAKNTTLVIRTIWKMTNFLIFVIMSYVIL